MDLGVPFSMCLQLQQLGLQLHEAQWSAKHSLGGFSISFFWPALIILYRKQPPKSKKKRRKCKVKISTNLISDQCTTAQQKPADVGSPVKERVHSPIVAHLPSRPESKSLQQLSPKPSLSEVEHSPHKSLCEAEPSCQQSPVPSSQAELSLTSANSPLPNLSECEDVQNESCNYVPGVSYKTLEGEEQWTPVIKRN